MAARLRLSEGAGASVDRDPCRATPKASSPASLARAGGRKRGDASTVSYVFDETASERVRRVKPSTRGEFEIVDVMQQYLEEGALRVEKRGRGFAWLDTGAHESLLDAGLFIRTIEGRQGLKIGCPEEAAFRMGFIDRAALRSRQPARDGTAWPPSCAWARFSSERVVHEPSAR